MRKAICVTALMLALTCPVYAGEMPNGAPQPPPPAPSSATQEPAGGEITTGAPDTLTQVTLDLLAALSSLL
jgi:hypothetical protein